MSIKPFSEVVDNKSLEEERIRPFVDSAMGGVEVEISTFDEQEIREQEHLIVKAVSFLGSLQGLFSVFVLFVTVVLIVDALQTMQGLYESASILDTVYFLALVLLLSTLVLVTYKNYREIMTLKSATRHQEAFSVQKEIPTKKIVPMTLELLDRYEVKANARLREQSDILRERISSSHDYRAIYKELDEEVLELIDVKVQGRIKTASAQAALSTAISPLALLDAGIVIWRSVRLTKEIAVLYGFKPGWIATVVLLKKGAFSVFFAGATELAVEYVNAASETTVVSKISLSAGQGISNGVLLARLGYGVMSACRPLPMRVKRQSFVVSIISSIKDTITDNKK